MVSCPNYQTMRQKKQAWQKMLFSSTFRFGVLSLICVFGVLYVMQTSSLSAKGYEMNDLEKKIQILEQDNSKLDCDIAEHKSMKNIETRLKTLELVSTDNTEYATVADNEVAMR